MFQVKVIPKLKGLRHKDATDKEREDFVNRILVEWQKSNPSNRIHSFTETEYHYSVYYSD